MDDFWLPLSIFTPFYYIVFSVFQWKTFDYPLVSSNLSITLYCLFFFNGRLLITPWYLQTFLLHCIFCPSSLDDFWIPLSIFKPFYYIELPVLLQWTTFDYLLVSSNLSITLYCLSFFNGRLSITPWYLQTFILHCIFCPSMDDFWLPLSIFKPFYYIVLSVLLQWTILDYPLVSSNLSVTLYCLSFFNGRLLITPWYLQTCLLHCIVCPSSMDDFWLPLCIFKPFFYIVLSVLLQWTTFDYPLVSSNLSITLYCLSYFNGRLLITPWYLQTFLLHCIVSPSSMDDFWLPLGIFKPVYYIVSSVLLQWKTFDYPLVSSNLSITLYCLSYFNRRLLITPWYLQTFLLHCIVCPSSMDDFWLPVGIFKPFYYIVLSVLLQWTTFDYPLVSSNISFTLYCLSFNGRLFITPWYLQAFLLHCIVCSSSMDDFWLPLCIFKPFYYIVLSVLLQWTTFDYPLVSSSLSITLYFLSFFNWRLLVTPWYLQAFLLHYIVSPSSMDDFWLPLGIFKPFYYIVLSLLLQWITFGYSLVSSSLSITLYCLSFFNERLLITPWYLQAFLWTTFDYPLVSSGLSITLYCLSFFNGRLLITPWYLQAFLLHCIVCPSSIDDFWLPLSIFKPFYYIVLSVLQWTTFDYPLVSSHFLLHCIFCLSMEDFWLPLSIFKHFYCIVLSVLLQWTTFDCPLLSSNLSITLYCLSFFNGRLLITP